MSSIVVFGTRFFGDVVETADGKVERLTGRVAGVLIQVNRHEGDDGFCTLIIGGRAQGRVRLDDVEFHVKTKLGIT